MIPELGNLALIIALMLALIQSVLPLVGAHRNHPSWMSVARPAAWAQTLFIAIAYVALTSAFIRHDFSVEYVAQHSNLLLPLHFRFTAVFSSHEGSLLLAVLILCLWTSAVALFSRRLPDRFAARLIGTMGIINTGMIAFTLFTSNPFPRLLPALPDGNDMNPLLQDPGMIIHPPLLYVGYFGLAVPFAFAVAAMLEGRLDRDWVRWSRPWTNVAWAFLTVGIALGSWWAYYELGWGGWWFWDPVENASFMPWLVGVALIHSQAATEKRGSFQSWTILLAIAAFSLSLLGGFLVRSGVITSVHAFASDPSRGVYLLTFVAIITGGALTLYALRAPKLTTGEPFAPQSRETLLLINNLFMSAAAAMVLLGTITPLINDAMGWQKISVGPPYFGLMFFWLMAPVVLFVAIAPLLRWGQGWTRLGETLRSLMLPSLAVILLPALLRYAIDLPWSSAFMLAGAVWIAGYTLPQLVQCVLRQASRGLAGMATAHLGIAVFLVGVALVDAIGTERDVRMAPGDTFEANNYQFRFTGVGRVEGPNYIADEGTFEVSRDDQLIATLHPQKRLYSRGGNIMTEAAIDPGLTRDLYVSLGEPLDDGQAWAIRVYVKPFVRWIWFGALMMAIGGIVAATDPRYRRARRAVPAGAAEAQQVPA